LYLKDRNGKEYFVEMKGPDPNKKEVRAAKEDLLNIVAIKKRDMTLAEFKKKIAVIFGIYYNNEKGAYKNWKVSPMFETGKGLFVQEEFWDFLGGKGAYKDLLEVIADVKELVVKEIENRFTNL
jgi:type II restriction enzyme